ncbi:PAAR domain-containing protein [Pseudomonas putida]|uniref:PAAR domain-containing protein n=1 Tax=Pseudomonas putida TaxID=303 RepID=A0A2Z4RQ66_PSEPU|nr:PAAR domain-containing protein [Pseudomonas putida]AWY42124.1 PAAR domain-containing protein [Pseudomonas putida]
MDKGYFIRKGDKTTCGGEVMDADTRVSMFGIAHARAGDPVTCGKDGKTYHIEGGISFINSHGRLVAGTLDSVSSCPCTAELIHSFTQHKYESRRATSLRAALTGAQPAPSPSEFVASYPSGVVTRRNNPLPERANDTPAAEPGFYIVPKSTTREQLESSLFTLRDPAVMGKFKLLNPNLGDVKAGSMIVLSDPNNYQCTRQEVLLMDVAAKTNRIIETLSAQEADFLAQHRDTLQAFLGYGSNAIGVGASIFKNNLDNVGQAIKDLEELQQKTLQRDGNLRSPKFFAERQRLLAQLNTHLTKLTRKSIGMPDHVNLKKKLGISSQSLVHLWTEASPTGQIPGHATHLEGVAKASKYVKYGGWLGTAIGGGASALKIQEVCTAGNTEACERVRFTEAGSFTGGVVVGGIAGAALSTTTVGVICVGLSVPTGGLGMLACGILVAGAGSYGSSALGGIAGEMIGERIFEATQ